MLINLLLRHTLYACGMLLISLNVYADTWKTEAKVGLSYDSNIYRTPTHTYIDYAADPLGTIIINPAIKSDFFSSVQLNTNYGKRINKKLHLIFNYNYRGSTYLNDSYNNADEHKHSIEFGPNYKFHYFKSRKSYLQINGLFSDFNQTYTDRDTGENKTEGNLFEDISDRYSYQAKGGEIKYRYWRSKKWSFKAVYKFEKRSYENTPVGPRYDNTYERLYLYHRYYLNTNTQLRLGYSHYIKDYDFRKAMNTNGQFPVNSQNLIYRYNNFDVGLNHQISKAVKLRNEYSFTKREDKFQGYNNYSIHEISSNLSYSFNHELGLKFRLAYLKQYYPNAWDFNLSPTLFASANSNHKSVNLFKFEISANYKIDKESGFELILKHRDSQNTDPRYNYNRSLLTGKLYYKFR